MKLSLLTPALALTTSVVNAQDAYGPPSGGLTVKTSSGSVRGFVDIKAPKVRQFLGIPFAQPPVKNLRWLPPKPLKHKVSKVIDAKHYPAVCPQFNAAAPSVYALDVPEYGLNPNATQSEDCLYLSVWAPAESKRGRKPLPVFFWIYGGGFTTGGTWVDYQLPTNWVQRSQDHIVISIQYRLNIFGFPNAAGLADNNLGILDQRLALEWARENVAAFGGDPKRIVLWGQSAGAGSVDYLNFAYYKDPIASGLIADSGSVLLPILSKDTAHDTFSSIAKHFKCTSRKTELDCLRKVPADKIEAYVKAVADTPGSPYPLFAPVPDEKVIFSNYTQRYAAGKVARVPAIFGSNRDEGTAGAPYPADPNTMIPDPASVKTITNSFFLCPATTTSQLRQQAGLDTYRYYFVGNYTNVSPRFWMGAFHGAELPHVFGTSSLYRGRDTAAEAELGRRMQDLWVNFARDPRRARGWAEYGVSKQALVFGSSGAEGVVARQSVDKIDAVCSNQ